MISLNLKKKKRKSYKKRPPKDHTTNDRKIDRYHEKPFQRCAYQQTRKGSGHLLLNPKLEKMKFLYSTKRNFLLTSNTVQPKKERKRSVFGW